jgi:hypothetical protein
MLAMLENIPLFEFTLAWWQGRGSFRKYFLLSLDELMAPGGQHARDRRSTGHGGLQAVTKLATGRGPPLVAECVG